MNMERRVALAELLARPDPPELRRGSRVQLEGKPDRFEILPILAGAFVQAKLLALEERRAEGTSEVAARVVPARQRPRALGGLAAPQAA